MFWYIYAGCSEGGTLGAMAGYERAGKRPEAVLQSSRLEPRATPVPLANCLQLKCSTSERPNSVGSTDVWVWSRLIGTTLLPAVLSFQYGNLRIAERVPDRLRSSALLRFRSSLSLLPLFLLPPSSRGTSYYLHLLLLPNRLCLFCPTTTRTLFLVSTCLPSPSSSLLVIYRWLKLMVCCSLNHIEQFPWSSSRELSSCVP